MIQNVEGRWSGRRKGGALLKLLLFLVIFGAVLAASWVYFLPAILTSTLQKRTGFNVKVTSLYFNPFKANVEISGLVLSNPAGFPQSEFMEVRSFQANARMKTLFTDRPVFDYARVDVAYVALVRNSSGLLNAQLFHDRLSPPVPPTPEELEQMQKEEAAKNAPPSKLVVDGKEITIAKKAPPPPPPKPEEEKQKSEEEKPLRYLIKRLEVRLEKVIVADYAVTPASVHEFNFRLFYSFNDVTDPRQLMKPFAFKSLQPVGDAIKALIPGGVVSRAADATTKTEGELFGGKKAGEQGDSLRTVVEKLEESQKP